jgi:hypothetical protein
MSEENKKLVRRWFEEVWNQQNEEAIDAMFASGGKAYGFPEPHSVLVGPESFKEIHRFFLGAFPDLRITVQEIITEGDKVAVRWTATMTHLGDHLGFAPTMKKETLDGFFLPDRERWPDSGWKELHGVAGTDSALEREFSG